MNWLGRKITGLFGAEGGMWLLFVLALCVGAWGGWLLNGIRMEPRLSAAREELAAERLAWANERLAAERARLESLAAAREQEAAWREAARRSETENARLRKKNDLAAAAARDAALRLRDEGNRITGELNRMPGSAADSGLGVARAASDALGECGLRYSEVAAEHDRCEAERRTLIGAWPR